MSSTEVMGRDDEAREVALNAFEEALLLKEGASEDDILMEMAAALADRAPITLMLLAQRINRTVAGGGQVGRTAVDLVSSLLVEAEDKLHAAIVGNPAYALDREYVKIDTDDRFDAGLSVFSTLTLDYTNAIDPNDGNAIDVKQLAKDIEPVLRLLGVHRVHIKRFDLDRDLYELEPK